MACNPSASTKLSPDQCNYDFFMVFNLCFDVSISILVEKIILEPYVPKLQEAPCKAGTACF